MGRDMSVLYRPKSSLHVEGRYLHERERERRYVPPSSSSGEDPKKYHSGSPESWRTEFFYEHPMHSSPDFIPASEALVRKDYKYLYWPNYDYEELFDLRNDPGEVNDLNTNHSKYKKKHPKYGKATHHKDENRNQMLLSAETFEILEEMRNRFLELKEWAHRDEEAIIL
mmetsp:Transcript_24201/g.36812  ORF Transcript_24201/g.36812 Transcript_24201/m.36812 type:complete len:169 (+) Transcript_24201:2-508(+)